MERRPVWPKSYEHKFVCRPIKFLSHPEEKKREMMVLKTEVRDARKKKNTEVRDARKKKKKHRGACIVYLLAIIAAHESLRKREPVVSVTSVLSGHTNLVKQKMR